MSFFIFVGAILLFFFSLKQFGKEMYHFTENKFLKLIEQIEKNKFLFFILGILITIVLQSSSLTICLLLILIHNKTLTPKNSIYYIMGSNIGTCVTAYLFTIPTESFLIGSLLLSIYSLIFNKKYRRICFLIVLVFLSIYIMKKVSFFLQENIILDILLKYKTPIYSLFISTIFTGIIQSSSIFITIIQSFLYQKLIDLNLSFYMILGSNIGTSITAILVGLSLDKDSKYCSYMNIVFNVIGALFMIIIMVLFPVTKILINISNNLPLVLAHFNLLANIINVVGVLPILPIIKKRLKVS